MLDLPLLSLPPPQLPGFLAKGFCSARHPCCSFRPKTLWLTPLFSAYPGCSMNANPPHCLVSTHYPLGRTLLPWRTAANIGIQEMQAGFGSSAAASPWFSLKLREILFLKTGNGSAQLRSLGVRGNFLQPAAVEATFGSPGSSLLHHTKCSSRIRKRCTRQESSLF